VSYSFNRKRSLHPLISEALNLPVRCLSKQKFILPSYHAGDAHMRFAVPDLTTLTLHTNPYTLIALAKSTWSFSFLLYSYCSLQNSVVAFINLWSSSTFTSIYQRECPISYVQLYRPLILDVCKHRCICGYQRTAWSPQYPSWYA
jgi:hypothetical protein